VAPVSSGKTTDEPSEDDLDAGWDLDDEPVELPKPAVAPKKSVSGQHRIGPEPAIVSTAATRMVGTAKDSPPVAATRKRATPVVRRTDLGRKKVTGDFPTSALVVPSPAPRGTASSSPGVVTPTAPVVAQPTARGATASVRPSTVAPSVRPPATSSSPSVRPTAVSFRSVPPVAPRPTPSASPAKVGTKPEVKAPAPRAASSKPSLRTASGPPAGVPSERAESPLVDAEEPAPVNDAVLALVSSKSPPPPPVPSVPGSAPPSSSLPNLPLPLVNAYPRAPTDSGVWIDGEDVAEEADPEAVSSLRLPEPSTLARDTALALSPRGRERGEPASPEQRSGDLVSETPAPASLVREGHGEAPPALLPDSLSPAAAPVRTEELDQAAPSRRGRRRLLAPVALGVVTVAGAALAISFGGRVSEPIPTAAVEAPVVSQPPAGPAALEDPKREPAKPAEPPAGEQPSSVVAGALTGAESEEPREAQQVNAAHPASGDSSVGSLVTVTVRSSPGGAMLFHNDQQIGNGRATLTMKRGGKARLLALLNNHEPTRLTIDGSRSEVVIYLKPNAPVRSAGGTGDPAGAVSASEPLGPQKPGAVDEGSESADEVVVPVGKPTPRSEAEFFRRMNEL
jgi:hypothetical protein